MLVKLCINNMSILIFKNAMSSDTTNIHTVFNWLNAMVTIRHVLKVDAAAIQRWPLLKGDVHYP